MQSFVSIIIPTYNRAYVFSETLDSVLAQTYINWECIIVDDRSTDNTNELVCAYIKKDLRFQYYSRPERQIKGAATCRNIGIEKSKGDYIIFLDSDDLLDITAIETRMTYFNKYYNEDGLVFTTQMFDLDIHHKKEIFNIDPNVESKENYLSLFLNQKYAWTVMSGIWKRSVIEKVKFNYSLILLEDVVFHIDILLISNISVKRIHIVDNFYRTPDTNKMNRPNKWLQVYSSFCYIFDSYKELINENKCLKISFSKFYKRVYFSILKQNITLMERRKYLQKIDSVYFINRQDKFLLWIISFFYRNNLNQVKGIGIYTVIKFLESKLKLQ